MKIVYFSVTSNEIPNLGSAVTNLRRRNLNLDLYARTRTQLAMGPKPCEEFIEKALVADILIVTLMAGSGSCPAWDDLILGLEHTKSQGLPVPYFHVQPTGNNAESMEMVEKYSRGFQGGQWKKFNQYYRYGGVDNLLNLLLCFHNDINGGQETVNPPQRMPDNGIYHPDLDYVPDLDQWLLTLNPLKPTIGIWFYQNFWTTGNKVHIDAMVREAEKQGANVICVFHNRFKDPLISKSGADHVVDHYFMDRGKPRIGVLINPVMFSLEMAAPEYKGLLSRLKVPVIQAMSTGQTIEQWQESPQGLNNVDITIGVAQPEMDGVIIGVTIAAKQFDGIDPVTGSAMNKYRPIPQRMEKLVSLALNWEKLSTMANSQKKIAVVFHHYPPRDDRIGCASGLDSFESVKNLLQAMQEQGYYLEKNYASGDEIARELLTGMTCDRRWLLPEHMAIKARAKAGSDLYMDWHNSLPLNIRKKMNLDWGEMPGDLFVHDGELLFPGVVNGNVFLTIQPPRGYLENIEKLYHDSHLSPPHHYLAQYRWIKEVFKAQAVLHVGKHGSLEWLPGKAVGLGDNCYPDLAIMDIPNVYIYIINDPGEGTQAKRRSSACIVDHLPPSLDNAELYEELAELDQLIADFTDTLDESKQSLMEPMIWEAVVKADIHKDLDLGMDDAMADFKGFMEKVHNYLSEIGDTTITKGLHILGDAPCGDELVETLVQLTRLSNAEIPSLRESVINALGFDLESLLENRGRVVDQKKQLTGGRVLERVHEISIAMVGDLLNSLRDAGSRSSHGVDPGEINLTMEKYLGSFHGGVSQALEFALGDLLFRLHGTTREISACLTAFDGKFVSPGPSGAPSRGMAHILPTGKNFFSVDPQKIPTQAAWKTGKKMAQALIDKYRREHSDYPKSVGIILWASPCMRSKGDDVAQILYFLGVKPLWQKGSGNVKDLQIIPLSQLKRPRIDVIPKISGMFRDAFPLLIDLIDRAVQMAAGLNEPVESNFIRQHVIRDMEDIKDQNQNEAFRQATFRIFGAAPGSYGTGVTELVESKKWETPKDLGNMFIQWSSHAYGCKVFGQPGESIFRKALNRISVTVKNEDSREKDMMSCTDFYGYHGGLISAVEAVQGGKVMSVTCDSSHPDHVKVRTTKEEANHLFRSRLLNPKWIEGLVRHGYKGAGDLSKAMDIILGWDATAGVVDDAMYQRFARKTALDKKMADWMKSVNPHALENIIAKLLEANARGMWTTDSDTLEELKEAYLEIEGDIEDATE